MSRAAAILLLTLAMTLAMGCRRRPAGPSDGKVHVVASVFPLADAVRQIGGEHVSVQMLLGGGQTPHDFEPQARHAEMLRDADLLVRVGLGLDDWAIQAARSAQPRRVLALGERVEHQAACEHDHGEHDDHADAHHHHHDGDPHIWLDPVRMQQIATAITDELISIDPQNRQAYEANLQKFQAELAELDAQYAASLGDVRRRHFVTFHRAFTYIAERYGLTETSLRGVDAADFTPQQLEDVVQFIAQHDVKAIFVEPQFPPERLETLAAQTGATVRVLDPIGGPGIEGYDSYLNLMRTNLRQLEAALNE